MLWFALNSRRDEVVWGFSEYEVKGRRHWIWKNQTVYFCVRIKWDVEVVGNDDGDGDGGDVIIIIIVAVIIVVVIVRVTTAAVGSKMFNVNL